MSTVTARGPSASESLERLGLTALVYMPFRVFFSANLVSNASWFIFDAAINTYVLRVTGSAGMVGLAAFIYTLPGALFMLHAGILTDRFGSRRLVAISLAGGGLTILAIGLLATWNSPLWIVLAVAFCMGILQTLGTPGFISIVNDLVPPRAISSAVALTFLGFNVGRITGGIAAGFLLAALGTDVRAAAALAIVVAGILQALPAIPIIRIRIQETAARTTEISLVRPLVESASYALRYPTLAVILLLSIAPGAVGLAYMYMLPVVIRDLGAAPDAIGLLYAGGGAGGLLAGLVAGPLMQRMGHGRALFVGLAAAAIGLIVTGAVGLLPVAIIGIGLTQAGFVLYASSSLALVQALAPARLRGRLTSLFTLLYWGLMPIGALAEGAVAQQTSSLVALVLVGSIMLCAGALALLFRRQVTTLRIEADGRSMLGHLQGSGLGSDIPNAAA
ncbi:MAG TPA: MFS transporter [Candidatus Saccharimonadales bacterium]|nr:MFS transporter [Candidatus Saccharimonadales bacterium]